ncbi:MAG: hypothetical protein IT578_05105 [Verrucomicrobiae bacterium]|nr:hypothetical protein [Verrucomicrobiae bacterium]
MMDSFTRNMDPNDFAANVRRSATRKGQAGCLSYVAFCFAFTVAQAVEPIIAPYDIDPPVQVDGDLSDWENVPNAVTLNSAAHATWQREDWTGPADLSATVRVAWRTDGLLVAAEVTDDIVQQPYAGADIWKGDYLNVLLDTQPASATEDGVIQLGISPGNFDKLPAEVYSYRPQGQPAAGAKVAAKRTARGYNVEAFVPFTALGMAGVKQDQFATFEIGVSDSDGTPAAQQTMLTMGTEKWDTSRARMLPLVFGDGNGQAAPPTTTLPLVAAFELARGERRAVAFNAGKPGSNHEPYLFFRAVTKAASATGYCSLALQVLVNSEPIDTDRLSNRGPTATMRDGRTLTVAEGNGRLLLARSPDFTTTDHHPDYALADGVKSAEYELYLGGLLRDGANTITLVNTGAFDEDYRVAVGDVEFRTRPDTPGTRAFKSAPTGELPVLAPRASFSRNYTSLKQQGATITFQINGRPYRVESKFSTPDGRWVTAGNAHFRHRRKVVRHNEWLIVRDTFTNLTDENLPVMQQHTVPSGDAATGVWLAGAKMPTKSGRHFEGGENPSAFFTTDNGGVGLLALNDELRVHSTLIADRGAITLHDPFFYLGPRATYTSEFAIVPVGEPDYFAFVNAARRLLDVNFPITVGFAFVFPPVHAWSDATLTNWVANKSATYLVQSNDEVKNKNGHYARGTDWINGSKTNHINFLSRLRRLYPDKSVKAGIYFDCFLDTTEENKQRFAADRALNAAGQHIIYGSHAYLSMYIPTLQPGGWGEEMARTVDVILDGLKFDGVYWDEFTQSASFWVYSHRDGCSADIDPATHRIQRLKGATPLLSREYRAAMVQRIRDKGALLVVNGAPCTRTLGRLKIMSFTETGSISHCRKVQLYCPLALGDHLTETSEKDAFRVMRRILEYGCLYSWYGMDFAVPYKTLTEHMFPFTPIEIHSGYVIGQERIITSRSGLFGWNDQSDFTAYVYDRDGRATDRYPVKKIERDGKTYAEVRLPEGCAAAIVRAASASKTVKTKSKSERSP